MLSILPPVGTVGVLTALGGYWVTQHWRLAGEAAAVVWFVAAFIAIGLLSVWFGTRD